MFMHPCSPIDIQCSPSEINNEIIFCTIAVELDDVDIQLLTALQEYADRTEVEFARLAGLSPAATPAPGPAAEVVRRHPDHQRPARPGRSRLPGCRCTSRPRWPGPARPALQPRVRRPDPRPAADHRGRQRGRRDRLPAPPGPRPSAQRRPRRRLPPSAPRVHQSPPEPKELMSCERGSLTWAAFREYLVGGLGPGEGVAAVVPPVDEVLDGGDEVLD
jgi:hypothetical protein